MEETQFKKLEIYKKWFKTKDKQGFCSITGWFEAGKVIIDIGEVTTETKATKCYVDAYDFLTWGKAVRDGTGSFLYPERDQCPTPESFVAFGGSGDVSRIFKAHWWNDGSRSEKNPDRGFTFKCGHFKGDKMSSGGIKPDFSQILSMNMIKMTHIDLITAVNKLDHALIISAIKSDYDWLKEGAFAGD